jgi:hypothetical protein
MWCRTTAVITDYLAGHGIIEKRMRPMHRRRAEKFRDIPMLFGIQFPTRR